MGWVLGCSSRIICFASPAVRAVRMSRRCSEEAGASGRALQQARTGRRAEERYGVAPTPAAPRRRLTLNTWSGTWERARSSSVTALAWSTVGICGAESTARSSGGWSGRSGQLQGAAALPLPGAAGRRPTPPPPPGPAAPPRTSPVMSSQSRPSGIGSPPSLALGSLSCASEGSWGDAQAAGVERWELGWPPTAAAVAAAAAAATGGRHKAAGAPPIHLQLQGGAAPEAGALPDHHRAPRTRGTPRSQQPWGQARPTSSSGMVWPRKRMPSSGSSRLVSQNMAGMPRMPPMACGARQDGAAGGSKGVRWGPAAAGRRLPGKPRGHTGSQPADLGVRRPQAE